MAARLRTNSLRENIVNGCLRTWSRSTVTKCMEERNRKQVSARDLSRDGVGTLTQKNEGPRFMGLRGCQIHSQVQLRLQQRSAISR